jgi:hypothetical protein
MQAWTAGKPRPLLARVAVKGAPDPKARCGDGMRRTAREPIWRRLVEGRPVRQVTTTFLRWRCQRLAVEQNKVVGLIWDHASGHVSRDVRTWIRGHQQRGKRHGGVRLLTCRLPVNSPGLHPVEPHGGHGKRAMVEPARTLTAAAVINRVWAYGEADHRAPLQQHVA